MPNRGRRGGRQAKDKPVAMKDKPVAVGRQPPPQAPSPTTPPESLALSSGLQPPSKVVPVLSPPVRRGNRAEGIRCLVPIVEEILAMVAPAASGLSPPRPSAQLEHWLGEVLVLLYLEPPS